MTKTIFTCLSLQSVFLYKLQPQPHSQWESTIVAMDLDEKVKSTSYQVPYYFIWYKKSINGIFRNSFEELENDANDM